MTLTHKDWLFPSSVSPKPPQLYPNPTKGSFRRGKENCFHSLPVFSSPIEAETSWKESWESPGWEGRAVEWGDAEKNPFVLLEEKRGHRGNP